MIDRKTVANLGHMDKVVVDIQTQMITGLVCKSGLLGNTKITYSWDQIEAIGDDNILVQGVESTEVTVDEDAVVPVGFEMLTDKGNKVGVITDLLFSPESGSVMGYLYTSSGWKGLMEGTYLLNPIAISSLGDRRMIVLEKAVENPQQYTLGVGDKLNQATEFIQADYERTKRDMAHIQQGTQGVVGQVKETAQATGGKLNNVATNLKDQFPRKKS